MEPIEYLRLARRRWRLLAACVLVAGVVAWITTPARPTNRQITYEATHILLRDTTAKTPPPALAQVALFVRSGEVPSRVVKRLGLDVNPGVLAERVKAKPDEAAGSLEITASAPSRAEAAKLANAFGEETLALFGEQAQQAQATAIQAANDDVDRLRADIDDIEAQIRAATSAGKTVGVLEAQRDAKIRQYALALDQQTQILNQPPPSVGYLTLAAASAALAKPTNGGFSAPQSRQGRTAVAVGLGFLLGLAALLIAERFDPRVHTRESVEHAFGLPVVAEVPDAPRGGRGDHVVLSVSEPLSATAEAYRTLRAAILLTPLSHLGGVRGHLDGASAPPDDEPQVILVTSPTPGEGKTTTVANLAAAFAETGRSVLVLSCDFRRPEIHHYLGGPRQPGLSEVLTGARTLADIARVTFVNGVYLAADGGGLRSLGDLATTGRTVIDQARLLADIVLIDTAPALATNDASELIPWVDAVVVICRSGATTAESARRTRVLLERLRTPTVGVVLVGAPEVEASYSGYYTTADPVARHKIPLGRTMRSPEIDERLRPFHVTEAPLSREAKGDAGTS